MAEFISVSAIKTSLTECPICTEQFDEDSRVPRRMPCCIQSICQPCLETYSRGRPTMSCPLCRHQHHLPGGIKSLPKEPLILKILDHLKIQKGIRLPCTGCPDNQGALAQCDNCGIFLCTRCLRAHERNMVTKKHIIVTFDEMKDRPVESCRHLHQCLEHEGPLQFFCKTCNKVICVSCTVVDHKEGKGHHVISVDEAHKEKRFFLEKVLDKLDEKAYQLDQVMEELQKKKKNTEKSRMSAKNEINKVFDSLVEELNQRRSVLLADIDQRTDENLNVTIQAFEATTTLLTKLKSSTYYTRQMRSKADKIEDLQLMVSSQDSLTSMLEETAQDVEFARTGIVFVPSMVQYLTSTMKELGFVRTVTYSPIKKPNGVAEEDAYNSITLEPELLSHVPDHHLGALKQNGALICPDLEWDIQTASKDITVTDVVVMNTIPRPVPNDTGCRIHSLRRVLASQPLVVKTGQTIMFSLKVNITLKEAKQDRYLLFESALVTPPVDSKYGQSGLGVYILQSSTVEQKLSLRVDYDDKTLSEVPIMMNESGRLNSLHLSFLLDGDTNKIHVVDVDDVRKVCSVSGVLFDRPLWLLVHVGNNTGKDISCVLISGNKITLSQKMKHFLTSLC